ncbi:NADH dehydrogenase [ubiquinone] 1 alpha subcomplex assembly factor 3 [Cariama cristata]
MEGLRESRSQAGRGWGCAVCSPRAAGRVPRGGRTVRERERSRRRRRGASRAPCRAHRLTPADDELYQRTRVTVLEPESANTLFIEAYTTRGFTVSGDLVVGPCAILPRAILQWNVGSYRDISHESLSLFRLLEPQIEILVLGTGDRVERLHPAMLKQMRECGIAVEVQDTPNACATFNFLTSEKRMVAAGLIPPRGTYMGM